MSDPPVALCFWMQLFLLTVGSFLLTMELLLTIDNCSFLLTVGALVLTTFVFYLQLDFFNLQWESASNKGLKRL